MKTKEQIKAYNKEYFARPEVIARAKIRNTQYRLRRTLYKKTEKGRTNENKYRRKFFQSEAGRDKHLRTRYGISLNEYRHILLAQSGVCAICEVEKNEKLHVDHCHKTNKVRGLLCGACNRALGLVKDDVRTLTNAIVYLSNV